MNKLWFKSEHVLRINCVLMCERMVPIKCVFKENASYGYKWVRVERMDRYTECSSLTHDMKKLCVQGSVLVVVYLSAPGLVSSFDKRSKMGLVDETYELGNPVSKRHT